MTTQGKNNRIKSLLAIALVVIALVSFMFVWQNRPTTNPPPTPKPMPSATAVTIHVFDVGEGLAVLIDDGEVEVVIDGGYKQYGAPFSDYIKPYTDGDIEYAIAVAVYYARMDD